MLKQIHGAGADRGEAPPRADRLLKLWGLAVAAEGGEMRSNYFQNKAPIKI